VVDRQGMQKPGSSGDDVLQTLLTGLPTARHVLLLDDLPLPELGGLTVARLADLVAAVPAAPGLVSWDRLPFDHPLWVMFSSGTTGPPKAMVHGAGGSLIEHVKEHRLHGDLGSGDTLYFHTTTAWMMWNWQLSALAVGAHVVLYDGPVAGPETLWDLVAEHGVTVFGTSPAYLQMCQDEGYRPRNAVDLSGLRAVLSTGAVLHDWQFAWAAEAVGPVPLQSISGGTDIIGCFVLGHPEEPVRPGRCQSLGLGLDVAALDEDGRSVLGEVGELVCRRPFPSRPVGFLGDPDGARFTEAYFAEHPGMWTHGDLIEVAADGSAQMHGRSDGVLNVNGIRIGPSEIYTIVRRLPQVVNAMAVEQPDPADPGTSRLVLLVVLRPGVQLDDTLAREIRSTLRREGSPAHVPAMVLGVEDLPTTHSGKPSERAAREALSGGVVRNAAALRNPGCLAALAAAARDAGHRAGDAGSVRSSGDDVTAVVARQFRDAVGAPVAETTNFFDAGGTSRQSMTLLRRLRMELGRPVSMEQFLSDPTIRGLVAGLTEPTAKSLAVELMRGGEDGVPPLFLVHGAHGDVDLYRSMVDRLVTTAPVRGLTAHLGTADGVGTSPVADLARRHAATVQTFLPEGPVRLAGFSFGGLVAFEVARRLTGMGRVVDFLGLLDVQPPTGQLSRNSQRLHHLAALMARFVPGMTEQPITGVFRRGSRPDAVSSDVLALVRAESLFNAHEWGAYAGPVTYFRARRRIPVLTSQLYAWRRVAPDLTVVGIPGAHHDLLEERYADVLAARVSAALQAATGRSAGA
jgi:acetoacetyl-CoA synthetase